MHILDFMFYEKISLGCLWRIKCRKQNACCIQICYIAGRLGEWFALFSHIYDVVAFSVVTCSRFANTILFTVWSELYEYDDRCFDHLFIREKLDTRTSSLDTAISALDLAIDNARILFRNNTSMCLWNTMPRRQQVMSLTLRLSERSKEYNGIWLPNIWKAVSPLKLKKIMAKV